MDGEELKPEICVIGAGPGGLAVAAAAAAFDVPVALVEKARLGGVSLNRGSLPTQTLIAAAERANASRHLARFGLKAGRFGVDFAALNTKVQDIIGALSPNVARARLAGLGVQVIEGAARFADPRTVTVGDAPIRALQADETSSSQNRVAEATSENQADSAVRERQERDRKYVYGESLDGCRS